MTRLDLSDVSVVVSLKADSAERMANLARLMDFYDAVGNGTQVIVVAQPPLPDVPDRAGMRLHVVADDGVHWKTRNMNLGASLSARPMLLMSDADTVPNPSALAEGVRLVKEGAGFVSLYNGIVVSVPAHPAEDVADWAAFLDALPHYAPDDVRPGRQPKNPQTQPLYGNAKDQAVGGCFLCSRDAFFGIGGWNVNFVSYGFEDQELHHRARVLNHEFRSIGGHNLYHLDHPRGPESRYGQFYRQNLGEFERVRSMDADTLAAYAARGFRQMPFEPGFDYVRFAGPDADGWHRIPDARIDLSDLTILVLADAEVVSRENSCLEQLLDHMEETFRDYDLRICENGTTHYKYPLNRKNVAYRTLTGGPSKEELERVIAEADRPAVYVLSLSADAERQLRIARACLGKVAHGLPAARVFPSADQALSDAG